MTNIFLILVFYHDGCLLSFSKTVVGVIAANDQYHKENKL